MTAAKGLVCLRTKLLFTVGGARASPVFTAHKHAGAQVGLNLPPGLAWLSVFETAQYYKYFSVSMKKQHFSKLMSLKLDYIYPLITSSLRLQTHDQVLFLYETSTYRNSQQ